MRRGLLVLLPFDPRDGYKLVQEWTGRNPFDRGVLLGGTSCSPECGPTTRNHY